jgi:hypothetical protein
LGTGTNTHTGDDSELNSGLVKKKIKAIKNNERLVAQSLDTSIFNERKDVRKRNIKKITNNLAQLS